MSEGGRLLFETRDVARGSAELPADEARDFVALSVKDTGAGIGDAALPRIFEPFFTTKQPGQGTGLGLSTVKSIVCRSGGYVTVKSSPGLGSTFTALLPVATSEPAEAEPPLHSFDLAARSGRLGTLLVCEDDEGVRKLMGDVLAIGSYRILSAPDAQQALALAERAEESIDLLVTDIALPGLDGPSLAHALRARRPALLVLFVSGYADSAALASMAGEEFLPKPFLPAELLKRVRGMLDRRDAPHD